MAATVEQSKGGTGQGWQEPGLALADPLWPWAQLTYPGEARVANFSWAAPVAFSSL